MPLDDAELIALVIPMNSKIQEKKLSSWGTYRRTRDHERSPPDLMVPAPLVASLAAVHSPVGLLLCAIPVARPDILQESVIRTSPARLQRILRPRR
jgi:hypothetical protein